MRVLQGHQSSVRCIDVCGNRVVSGSYDTTCRVSIFGLLPSLIFSSLLVLLLLILVLKLTEWARCGTSILGSVFMCFKAISSKFILSHLTGNISLLEGSTRLSVFGTQIQGKLDFFPYHHLTLIYRNSN